MQEKIKWGVLSTARIGTEQVIPAMQQCELGEVVAIASRDLQQAQTAASDLGIETAHGSYEALLADDGVDAVYNPLPNHLHVQWSEKALAAGKHVLCEKPVALTAEQAVELRDAAATYPSLIAMEAFMYRFHPQWITVRQWVKDNRIGELRSIQTFFSYYNDDAANIRNQPEMGGGGLMDIGCYPISQSRFLVGREPERVFASMEIHPDFGTDVIASAILDFGGVTATFTCSTQMFPYQRANIVGTEGRIEIEIPVNAPANQPTKLWLTREDGCVEEVVPACNQYTLQADVMSAAILNGTALPVTLDDAVSNMRVIDACVISHQNGSWLSVGG
jgi:predicted dehydrogenase